MTQQEIVNAVNNLVVGYSVTWDDIKYDADKAIYKINDRLGAKFPEMSRVLQGPQHHYAIKAKGKFIPIFDSRYIVTVVVPFIAMEILARDEEFTTIYNKYNMDFEDNLFLMYSNEYNRINPLFLQNDDVGVFFTNEDSVIPNPVKNLRQECKTFTPIKLRLTFNINNDVIALSDISPFIPKEYNYQEQVEITDPVIQVYSQDGTERYDFVGWYEDAYCTSPQVTSLTMDSDKELFAKWNKVTTLTFVQPSAVNGIIHTYPKVITGMTMPNLTVPRYIKGMPINSINFNSVNVLPNSVRTLSIGSNITYITKLDCLYLEHITFPEDGQIEIEDGAIELSLFNLNELYFTSAIKKFSWNSITNGIGREETYTLVIYFNYPKSNKPYGINLMDNNEEVLEKTFDNVTVRLVFDGE